MTHFPDHPHDGQQVVEEIGYEQVRIWTYSQAENEWTYQDYGGTGPVVFTDQVLVRENTTGEGTHSALAEPSELKTQKEVNYYLDEKFGQSPDINLDDYATEAWVQQGFAPKNDLYKVEAKVGIGVWQFQRQTGAARPGEFRLETREGLATETWTAVDRLSVNERDRRNMEFDFNRVADGDEVLITNKTSPNNYARFRIQPGQGGTFGVTQCIEQMGRAISNDDHDLEVVSRAAANYATKTSVEAVAYAMVNQIQSMESAQGTKSKGKWQHHGGPLPDSGIPAESQFWMADESGNKTQEYCEATVIRMHAVGISDHLRSNNVLGAAEVGDRLIIQDLVDLDGCEYEITSVEFHDPEGDNYDQAYAVYGVKADDTFCRGSVTPAELVSVRIKSNIGRDYLPLGGGSITGNLSVAGSLSNQGGIMLAGPRDKGFYVYDLQGGAVFSAYGDKFGAGVQYFGAVDQAKHVATKEYVDNSIGKIEIPEAGGGLGFTEEYNGNRYYKPGLDTTSLSSGEVMFLQNGVTTDVFAAVTHVALPEAGIDWTKFTRTGTIEVRNGGTLCGHLQVVSAKNNSGRNWLVKVKMLDIASNELEPESGHPCYFWGMFTG